MFLVARALDAISDPCMGLLADRTRSRWGKFRPWVLFGALPFGIVCVLAYSTPDLSMNGKMIYAAITYTLLTLLYTVVNIPYCALGGVITNDPTQRISLQSWRFVLATAGGMLSTVLMMPLVNLIGGDNKPLGFQGGIAVLSVVAFMMLAFCFFTTKERVEAPPTTTSMREDLRDIWQNGLLKRPVADCRFTNHFQYPGGVRTRWGDDVLRHMDFGHAGSVCRFSHHLLRG